MGIVNIGGQESSVGIQMFLRDCRRSLSACETLSAGGNSDAKALVTLLRVFLPKPPTSVENVGAFGLPCAKDLSFKQIAGHLQSLEASQDLASLDKAHVQNLLGLCYCYGLGIEQNQRRSIQLWQAAAEQKLADAEFNLGSIYHFIAYVSIPQRLIQFGEPFQSLDVPQATSLLQRAAQQGHAIACEASAFLCQDPTQAEIWRKKAVKEQEDDSLKEAWTCAAQASMSDFDQRDAMRLLKDAQNAAGREFRSKRAASPRRRDRVGHDPRDAYDDLGNPRRGRL